MDLVLLAQIIIGIALICTISVQVKGGGFSRNFTAGSFSRRGLERLVFRATFVLMFLFIFVSIAGLAI
jgi:preprotein translocase subunit SecG